MSAGEALNNRPNALVAQKLIQKARQQVARSHDLIERGRKLGQKAEQTLQAFRKPPEGCVGQSLGGALASATSLQQIGYLLVLS